jgi:hypothetical protein
MFGARAKVKGGRAVSFQTWAKRKRSKIKEDRFAKRNERFGSAGHKSLKSLCALNH